MLKAHTRKWGNSVGIVIPRDVVQELNLKPHEDILVDIHKKSGTVLRELFGALHWKTPTEEVLRQARRELESKY